MVETNFDTSIINQIDLCLKEKIKSNWINERWIRKKKNVTKFVGLRAKTFVTKDTKNVP